MQKQVIILLAILLGISLLISGGITIVTNNYSDKIKKEREEETKIHNAINEEHNKFKKEAGTLSKTSVEVIDKISKVTEFYDSIESNYKLIGDTINEYEQLIKKFEEGYKALNGLCIGKTYYKYEVDNKCRAYEQNMEQITNNYIKNVEAINAKIEEYNKWAKEEENKEHKQLEKIVSKLYTEYVDINSDGKFEGKQES